MLNLCQFSVCVGFCFRSEWSRWNVIGHFIRWPLYDTCLQNAQNKFIILTFSCRLRCDLFIYFNNNSFHPTYAMRNFLHAVYNAIFYCVSMWSITIAPIYTLHVQAFVYFIDLTNCDILLRRNSRLNSMIFKYKRKKNSTGICKHHADNFSNLCHANKEYGFIESIKIKMANLRSFVAPRSEPMTKRNVYTLFCNFIRFVKWYKSIFFCIRCRCTEQKRRGVSNWNQHEIYNEFCRCYGNDML